MTNEEAIKILKSKMDGSVDQSYEWGEAIGLAIYALNNRDTYLAVCKESLEKKNEFLVDKEDFNALKTRVKILESQMAGLLVQTSDESGNIRDFNGKKIGTGRIIPDGRGGWMYEGTNTEVQYTDHTCYTFSRNSDRCDVCGALLPNNLGGSK